MGDTMNDTVGQPLYRIGLAWLAVWCWICFGGICLQQLEYNDEKGRVKAYCMEKARLNQVTYTAPYLKGFAFYIWLSGVHICISVGCPIPNPTRQYHWGYDREWLCSCPVLPFEELVFAVECF